MSIEKARVQDVPGLYAALQELARTHTVWTPEGGLFTDGHMDAWRKVRMAVDMNVNPTPSPVAREEIARASAGGGETRCQITGHVIGQWVEHTTCSCGPCRVWRDAHVAPAQPAPAADGDLPERLERGATKSLDYGMHLNKYQALCDEAAKALRAANARIRELEAERDTDTPAPAPDMSGVVEKARAALDLVWRQVPLHNHDEAYVAVSAARAALAAKGRAG